MAKRVRPAMLWIFELAHQALAMGFHRAGADIEAAGDFLVAEAFGDQGQDFPLTSGQVGRYRARRRCGGPTG